MPPNELSNPFPVENAGNPAYSRRPPTTVLLVGPDPGDRPLLASVFALPEWKPYWTCNYREAMQALICDRMTVIICDRYLPDGCWKDVLSQTQILSRTLRASSLPVHCLTPHFGRRYSTWAGTTSWKSRSYGKKLR